MNPIEAFKRLCKRLGGKIVEDGGVVSCVKLTQHIGRLSDWVDEFHDFVQKYGRALTQNVRIAFMDKLLGGWSEETAVEYDPNEDKYIVKARVYSEAGVEPEYVEDVIDDVKQLREVLPSLGVTVEAEGWVEQNRATDEFAGAGTAWASIPRMKVGAKPNELSKLIDKVLELASDAAEAAKDEFIIPVGEE